MNYFAIINSLISVQQGLLICLNILAWLFMVGGAGVGLNIKTLKKLKYSYRRCIFQNSCTNSISKRIVFLQIKMRDTSVK